MPGRRWTTIRYTRVLATIPFKRRSERRRKRKQVSSSSKCLIFKRGDAAAALTTAVSFSFTAMTLSIFLAFLLLVEITNSTARHTTRRSHWHSRSIALKQRFQKFPRRQHRRRRRKHQIDSPFERFIHNIQDTQTSGGAARTSAPRTFHLHPTAALSVESERRRLIDSSFTTTNAQQQQNTITTTRRNWFLKEQNAVYATIPDPHDPTHRHNRQLQEFHSHRHLSRFEQAHRRRRGLDFHLKWNGFYDHGFFARFFEPINNSTTTHIRAPRNESSSSSIRQGWFHGKHRHLDSADDNSSFSIVSAGGQFNNYQAVPLSQGYGTHFANVWVGSPTPQRKTVIVDTGSHYTAFPCTGCSNCGAPHHTDPYYRPEKSDTFHQLQCSECQEGVICENGQCRFRQAYTEGSSWEAIQVKDQFYCGGSDVLDSADPNDQKYTIEFMFGCQASMTGLFITQLADGIMGMSAHPATLPKKLYDEGKIEHNMFAMCYRRELGTSKRGVTAGSMTLGGVSNNLDTSPMIYAKNIAKIGWFTVLVKNIYVRTTGGQSAKSVDPVHKTIKVRLDVKTLNSGKGVIVDSGTTDTYLNKHVAKEFLRAWKKATGQPYSHAPMALTSEQLRSLPTVLIQCQAYSNDLDPSISEFDSIPGYTGGLDPDSPKDLLIAVPATSYMDYSPITKRYMSRLYFTETVGGVLGSNTMQGHNVLFDWQNGRVGFAESSCAYDKKEVPDIAEDSGFESDCQVTTPVLTTPCIETVDRPLCKLNPTSVALLGKETWTVVVRSPGNDAGILCTEAAKSDTPVRNEYDDPVVTCSGHGVCEEVRPCQLTCPQLKKATEAEPVTAAKKGKKKKLCEDSGWSACDYGCMQTRIRSTLFSDGHCHEVSRQTRPCHIGACARSDPCRVPFIVHTVLAFQDGQVSEWTRDSEDVLAVALANAVQRRSGKELFQVGDIHIALAFPWYRDQDEVDAEEEISPELSQERDYSEEYNSVKLGMKVVMEISMFNPLSGANNRTVEDDDSVAENGLASSQLSSMLQNITDRLRGYNPMATCRQSELYPLAKLALEAKNILSEDGFMQELVTEMIAVEGDVSHKAAFAGPINSSDSSTWGERDSRVVSVWTIRTGIEEEINYFGPQKPFSTRLLSFIQNMVLITVGFFLIMAIWSFMVAMCDYLFGKSFNRKPMLKLHQNWKTSFYALMASAEVVNPKNPSRVEYPCDDEKIVILGTAPRDNESPRSNKHLKWRRTEVKKRPPRTNSRSGSLEMSEHSS